METVPANRAVSGLAFFVTSSTARQCPVLVEPDAARLVQDSLQFFRARKEIELYGFVVMPDHIHLIVRPLEPLTLPAFVKRLKSYTAHALQRGPIWNKGYWSEVVADPHYLQQKLVYLHENPVRAGLCANAEHWPWTSAGEYASGVLTLVDSWLG